MPLEEKVGIESSPVPAIPASSVEAQVLDKVGVASAVGQTQSLVDLQRLQLQQQIKHQRNTQRLELDLRKSELAVALALDQDRMRLAGTSEAVFDSVLPRIEQTGSHCC